MALDELQEADYTPEDLADIADRSVCANCGCELRRGEARTMVSMHGLESGCVLTYHHVWLRACVSALKRKVRRLEQLKGRSTTARTPAGRRNGSRR